MCPANIQARRTSLITRVVAFHNNENDKVHLEDGQNERDDCFMVKSLLVIISMRIILIIVGE